VIDDGAGDGVDVIDDGAGAGVDVIDDGAGADAQVSDGVAAPAGQRAATVNGTGTSTRVGGHGLAGLAERARLLNGMMEAGALVGGGYRLAVTVPVSHS
jgi:signal transduction histidine kinase